MTIQFIKNKGVPEYVVVPVADYEELLKKAELLDDVVAFDQAVENEEESLPAEMVARLVNGENKVKVWREYRGMRQSELAHQANLAQAMISQIESGRRTGSARLLSRLATVLSVDLDDLVG